MGHIWVIPTSEGMGVDPHLESNPHHIAAFNALLKTISKRPLNESEWLEMGKVYMAILGYKEIWPIRSESSDSDLRSPNNECFVAFSDRPITKGQAYNKWTLTLDGPCNHKSAVLADVSTETIASDDKTPGHSERRDKPA
jgi:hypothetical protein